MVDVLVACMCGKWHRINKTLRKHVEKFYVEDLTDEPKGIYRFLLSEY